MPANLKAGPLPAARDALLAGVGACVVAWQPGQALLTLLHLLLEQLEQVVLVDNGGAAALLANALSAMPGEPGLSHAQRARLQLLSPGRNLGVAAAHNLGLQHLFAQGCRQVVLFDQDSLPAADMLQRLVEAQQGLLAAGLTVAAVGPRHHAAQDGEPAPFVRLARGRVQLVQRADAELSLAACRCDFLITSGCLIDKAVVERVGLLDESLFIDNVDIEWCYRAAARGLHCYGVLDAGMRHALGDRRQRLPLLHHEIVIHSPVRIYYMMRNRWRLYAMAHVPLAWKLADIPRMLAKQLIFSLLITPRGRYLRAGVAGLVDGLLGRGGPARRNF